MLNEWLKNSNRWVLLWSKVRYTLATELTVADTFDFVADRVKFVVGFDDKSTTTWIRQFVTVDIVTNSVDIVESGRDFCRQNVERHFNFVTNVYGAKATRSTFFQQSRPCWIQLCRQCVPGLSGIGIDI